MVMAPALPNLRSSGVQSSNNNPEPSKAKVDTGVSNHSEEEMVRVNLADPQTLGVWNMFKNADDPSHVSFLYHNYKNSKHCSVPKNQLRRMRDVMISDMKEKNKESDKPRKQTQVGRNAPTWNDPQLHIRRGA